MIDNMYVDARIHVHVCNCAIWVYVHICYVHHCMCNILLVIYMYVVVDILIRGCVVSEKDGSEKSAEKKLVDDPPAEEEEVVPGMVEDCWPAPFYRVCGSMCCGGNWTSPGWQRWTKFREIMHRITEHKAFEYFILAVIFASSVALCFEDIYLYRKQTLTDILSYLNIAFVVVFAVEMLMKWVSLGFKRYFTRFWTILDFCIVVVSTCTVLFLCATTYSTTYTCTILFTLNFVNLGVHLFPNYTE